MNTIKSILQKFGQGLILGLGAGVTAGIIFSIVSHLMYKDVFNNDEVHKIKITEHHEIVHNNGSTILGTIKNNSDKNIRGFQIKVDLYTKNGKFVEQCDEYISTLSSEKETNFKVVCKKCDNNKTIEHDSYKIYINDY